MFRHGLWQRIPQDIVPSSATDRCAPADARKGTTQGPVAEAEGTRLEPAPKQSVAHN
jgi:hypothetical protein